MKTSSSDFERNRVKKTGVVSGKKCEFDLVQR